MKAVTMQTSKNSLSFPQTGLRERYELVSDSRTLGFGFTPQIHQDEISRNRRRVREINQYIDHMQSELDNLEYTDIID